MSILEQLEDWVLSEAELTLGSYGRRLESDLEHYADRLVARILRVLALGAAAVTLLTVGSVFVLLGTVEYLSSVVTGPLAWGLVGLGSGALGVLLLLLARR